MTPRHTTRDLALAALFAALTALAAYVSFPVYGQVPFSLQDFVVMLAGLVLGWRLAPLSMTCYVLLGLVAPVYAHAGSGLGVLFGPTGGYLFGFILGAFLVGLAADLLRARGVWRWTLAATAGLVGIYGVGLPWLAWQLGAPTLHGVLVLGCLQFLPLDLVKALLAALVVRALVAAGLELPALRGRTGAPPPPAASATVESVAAGSV